MGLCSPICAGINAEMTLAGKYFRNSILNSVNEFAQIFLAQKQKLSRRSLRRRFGILERVAGKFAYLLQAQSLGKFVRGDVFLHTTPMHGEVTFRARPAKRARGSQAIPLPVDGLVGFHIDTMSVTIYECGHAHGSGLTVDTAQNPSRPPTQSA